MKLRLFILCLFSYYFAIAQNNKPNAEILIDPDFIGKIKMYNKPGGKCIKLFQAFFKDEYAISMTIKGENDSMLYISVDYYYDGYIGNGWVKKSNRIGVYTKYDVQGVALYTSPTIKSQIVTRLKKSTTDFLKVIGSRGKWLKVEKKVNGILKVGWLPPEMQCANPYTTCA